MPNIGKQYDYFARGGCISALARGSIGDEDGNEATMRMLADIEQ
jgi:hypothetical protein